MQSNIRKYSFLQNSLLGAYVIIANMAHYEPKTFMKYPAIKVPEIKHYFKALYQIPITFFIVFIPAHQQNHNQIPMLAIWQEP